jgi:hypothetical protein
LKLAYDRFKSFKESRILWENIKMKKCIHANHPVHLKKGRTLDIPDDAKYCPNCGLPQEDILGVVNQIQSDLHKLKADIKDEIGKFSSKVKNERIIKEANKSPLLQEKEAKLKTEINDLVTKELGSINSQINRIDELDQYVAKIALQIKVDQDTIFGMCQNLDHITNKDSDMKKYGADIQSFVSNMMMYVTDIIPVKFLNEAQKLLSIYKSVLEINSLIDGKALPFLNKIKDMLEAIQISTEEHKTKNYEVPTFSNFISQEPKPTYGSSTVANYLNVISNIYNESIREFGKSIRQNMDKWAIARFKHIDRDLNSFIDDDIPKLIKIVEIEKEKIDPGKKGFLNAKERELISVSEIHMESNAVDEKSFIGPFQDWGAFFGLSRQFLDSQEEDSLENAVKKILDTGENPGEKYNLFKIFGAIIGLVYKQSVIETGFISISEFSRRYSNLLKLDIYGLDIIGKRLESLPFKVTTVSENQLDEMEARIYEKKMQKANSGLSLEIQLQAEQVLMVLSPGVISTYKKDWNIPPRVVAVSAN